MLLRGGQNRFGLGSRFDDLALGEILLGVFDGFFEHALDFGVADAVAGLDFDGVLLAGAKIFRGDLQDAVGVDQEFHFDARQARGRGRHFQSEARERAAIFREFAFALQHVNVDAGLVVDAGRVQLLRAGGNRGVARDDFRDGAAVGFDAERKRRDVEQKHVGDAAIENVGLHGGAEGDDFVGIQLGVRLAVEKFLHGAADERRARGAADENDFVDIGRLELRVGKRLLHRTHRAVDDRADQRLESVAREFVHEDGAIREAGSAGWRNRLLRADALMAINALRNSCASSPWGEKSISSC